MNSQKSFCVEKILSRGKLGTRNFGKLTNKKMQSFIKYFFPYFSKKLYFIFQFHLWDCTMELVLVQGNDGCYGKIILDMRIMELPF